MQECIISVKNQTVAGRAKRAAATEKIKCEIVSIDPKMTKKGCSYGLKLACDKVGRLIQILDGKGISHGDLFGNGGL